MLRRNVLEGALRRPCGHGFKILVDILASSPRPLRAKELPYEFRERQHSESKLDTPARSRATARSVDLLCDCALAAIANVGIAGCVFFEEGGLVARGSCRRRSRIGLALYRLRFHLEAKPRRDINNSVYDAP
jgi:hypothetical protein